jgi:LPXTG-motif cell wall-anchored protein
LPTTVTRAVLAVAAGLTLAAATAPIVLAQEDTPQPEVLVRVLTECEGNKANVSVFLDGPDEQFTVNLTGSGKKPQVTKTHPEQETPFTVFKKVNAGDYTIDLEGYDGPADKTPVSVQSCTAPEPAEPTLDVQVKCAGGWGVVTFQVTNPETGDSQQYVLNVDGSPGTVYEPEDLGGGLYLRITENLFEDGSYTAVLTGDSLDAPIKKTFEVKCGPKNKPEIFAYARCDDKDDITSPASVRVSITNPNRGDVEYVVTAGDKSETVTVPSQWDETVDLGPFPGGDYPITVVGSDGTETATHVVVDTCEDVKPDTDGLQVVVRCADGESAVTFRYYAVGPYPAERTFSVEGKPEFDDTVTFPKDGPYQWTRYDNAFEDGTYVATLTGDGLKTREEFTVECDEDQPPTTTTTAPPTSGTTTPPTTVPTSTPPVPGPGDDDDLPVTGAAVTGMVLLGLAALGLGGGLLIVSRRRKRA